MLYRYQMAGSRLSQGELIHEAVSLLVANPARLVACIKKTRTFTYGAEQKILSTTFAVETMSTATSLAKEHGVTRGQVIDLAVRDYLVKMEFYAASAEKKIVQPEAIKIVRWRNTFEGSQLGGPLSTRAEEAWDQKTHTAREQLVLSLASLPLGACVFVDATVLFLGITYTGTNPAKPSSLQCAKLIDGAGKLDYRCFTSVFEIARLSELLGVYAEKKVPPGRFSTLLQAIPAVGIDAEDLLLADPAASTLSVRAASAAFSKWGSTAAVATASSDFDRFFEALLGHSRKQRLDDTDIMAIYVPTDIRR